MRAMASAALSCTVATFERHSTAPRPWRHPDCSWVFSANLQGSGPFSWDFYKEENKTPGEVGWGSLKGGSPGPRLGLTAVTGRNALQGSKACYLSQISQEPLGLPSSVATQGNTSRVF